jgi:hypothetical protein
MDRYIARRWLKGLGVLLGLLLLAGMLTFHANDPSLTNLRYPHTGVQNLLGLPGALLGGSLVELLGASALGIPFLLLHRLLQAAHRRRSLLTYGAFGTAALLLGATLHGLASQATEPGAGAPGLAGLAGGAWVLRTIGPWGGLLLLAPAFLYALAQLFPIPLLQAALRDARTFGAFFLRAGREQLRNWRNGLAELPHLLAEKGRAGQATIRRMTRRMAARLLLSMARLPIVGQLVAARAEFPPGGAVAPQVAATHGRADGKSGGRRGLRPQDGDPFDAWLGGGDAPAGGGPVIRKT